MYTITRQLTWPEGKYTVEIVQGNIDNVSPDALSSKYEGEFSNFQDPREAIEVALKIAEQWQKDESNEHIQLAWGDTMEAMFMLESKGINHDTIAELNKWAEAEYNSLPKCSYCNAIMPDNEDDWFSHEYCDADVYFCSEYCAEQDWEESLEYLEENGGNNDEEINEKFHVEQVCY